MIGIDIRFMSANMKDGIISSGVGLFCADILNGIKDKDKNDIALIIDKRQKSAAEKLFKDYKVYEFNYISKGRLRKYLQKIETVRFSRFLRENGIRCLWYPHATPYNYQYVKVPIISTVHDLITVHDNPQNSKWRIGFKKILEDSSMIITDSEYVKKDILHTFPDTKKITVNVISCPVTVNLEGSKAVSELEGKKYILDINAYQNRKNAITLMKAYADSGLSSRCELVFCGGYNEDNYLELLMKKVSEFGIDRSTHFYLAIPIAQRDWLLKNASMLVSPSMSEGFGKTPVEAAMCCIPVITSTADSLVEVTLGKVKYYSDPENVKMLSQLLIEVFENPPERETLQIIAEELKEQYNPVRIANEYLKIIRQFDME